MTAAKPARSDHPIPDGWQRVALKEVLELEQPGAWGNDPTQDEPGVRVLRAADLTRDGRINPENAAWRRLSVRDLERRLMRDGDMILERSGGGPGTPVGRVALIEGLGSVYCNNFCQQLRVNREQCTTQFAARALWYRYTQGITARLEHQTTGIRNLDYSAYLDLPILLPPLPEQRAIAAVLDSIDDAIEGAEAVIAATEGLRDALLHDLLTRGLPGQHTEFRDVPGLGTIPADWEVVRLGDVATVQTGRAVKKVSHVDAKHEVPYLSVANVKDGYLDLTVVKTMRVSDGEIERFSLQHGDVLFTEGGDADKLGRGTVWRTEILNCLHQNHVFAVRPHSDALTSEFLSFFAGSGFGKRYFLGAAKQTTNLASVNSTQLKDMTLPLPDIREQKDIVWALGRVGAATEVAQEELAGLRLLKESTADALLTGRVRV